MTSRGTRYWNSGSIPLIAPDMLGDIIATASDLAIVVTLEGAVLSVLVNPNHKSYGALDHWEGDNLREYLTAESIPKLDGQLKLMASGAEKGRAVELNHVDSSHWEFPVRYTLHRIGPDGTVLMLGRDLRPIAEMQQQLVKAQLALERDYEAQREYDTRYRVLMETLREALVFVSMGTGRITDLNDSAALLLGATRDELTGAAFAQEFEGRRRNEFMESLTTIAFNETGTPVELQARRSRRRLVMHPTFFRAGGERVLLCRFELTDVAGPALDDVSGDLASLFRAGPDAIVFTDPDGTIRTVNEAFLNLVDGSHAAAVKGRSLGDFLARGGVDLKVLVDNASRTGQVRSYATRLASEYGAPLAVELSAAWLADRAHPVIAFVIRDASRAEALRKSAAPGGVAQGSPETAQSVIDLVGSASLKDIVAETTDVVEKLCIETAVELTRNNRVAAAEMLGLSRQSLYVKLRKYGLLARDDA